ncbi:mannose-6-phosphate isomerase [Cryobacterium mesophilum]|uniref:mannose-6-phosphate isomerase n=1 Tax=Terrimesophilobacter mesophilus TaxID=433647 RepID=A0A4R8V9N0_9MICO|nr:mannose-6-phosphate isomerase, class I [Terrimesophilobacter mesophilus]MBB5632642.1 mannose-6-phosphate isomerase [Terrimesophilobacter mesophilus]TFB79453.1 mannose-6-phosphate isomerase, class I [Terrimesophilobacter mesophilus]
MFVAIANTPRDYAWGSASAIAELLGTVPSGGPEAELWLGDHPGSPARIVDPNAVGGSADLAAWIASDPRSALGDRTRLPFLMKVLAASAPLSLQAHPTAEQAREGFERENVLGIPLDAPHRNYRDAHPKPEVIYALSESFDALCGFRPLDEARLVLVALGLDELVPRLSDLSGLFAWLMGGGADVDDLVARVSDFAAARSSGIRLSEDEAGALAISGAIETVRTLSAAYPGDAGILSALLLNRVTMRRGEALYLPAGNIHTYLSGLGIEVMTASDNVLRGGLTPKHVDVGELLAVVDFTPGPPPWLRPNEVSPQLGVFRPGNPDFVLAHVAGDAELDLSGPAIALCVAGSMTIRGARSESTIMRGEAVYVTPDERRMTFFGRGEVLLATTP